MKLINKLTAFLITLLIMVSCNEDEPTTAPLDKNDPPIIHSISVNPSGGLDWGDTCIVIVIAVDPEGDSLNYLWKTNGGTFLSGINNDAITWKAPDSTNNFIFTVSVSDEENKVEASDTVVVSDHPLLLIIVDRESFPNNF